MLECKFPQIPDPDRAAASAWRKLLETNGTLSPAHFSYNTEDHRLYLHLIVPVSELETNPLRERITAFDRMVRDTRGVWSAVLVSQPELLTVLPRLATLKGLVALQGTWAITEASIGGQSLQIDPLLSKELTLKLEGTQALLRFGAEPRKLKAEVNLDVSPQAIDFVDEKGKIEKGIYELTGDAFHLRLAPAGQPRPTAFDAAKGKDMILLLRRVGLENPGNP